MVPPRGSQADAIAEERSPENDGIPEERVLHSFWEGEGN